MVKKSLKNQKINNMSKKEESKKKLANLSSNPFKINNFSRTNNLKIIRDNFFSLSREELKKITEEVSVTGRVMRVRDFGSLIFADLMDQTANIQLMINKNEQFKDLNIGDIIGVEGIVCKSQKGELSLEVKKFTLLSKCLKPLPDTHYGFSDTEERFRKRYLDFIINSEKREILVVRHQVIQKIRQFLDQKEFIEIETPILVSDASGAQAKPFITHHNKLQ